jgi:hypothetical protein
VTGMVYLNNKDGNKDGICGEAFNRRQFITYCTFYVGYFCDFILHAEIKLGESSSVINCEIHNYIMI